MNPGRMCGPFPRHGLSLLCEVSTLSRTACTSPSATLLPQKSQRRYLHVYDYVEHMPSPSYTCTSIVNHFISRKGDRLQHYNYSSISSAELCEEAAEGSAPESELDPVLKTATLSDEHKTCSHDVVPGKGPPPEPPVDCCMSGCVNCVWIQYAEELRDYYSDGDSRAKEAINAIENPSLKAFIKLELGLK